MKAAVVSHGIRNTEILRSICILYCGYHSGNRSSLHAACMYDIHDAAPYDAVAIFKENDSWKTDVSDAPDASDT